MSVRKTIPPTTISVVCHSPLQTTVASSTNKPLMDFIILEAWKSTTAYKVAETMITSN